MKDLLGGKPLWTGAPPTTEKQFNDIEALLCQIKTLAGNAQSNNPKKYQAATCIDPTSPMTERHALLQQCLDAGDLNPRDPLGQQHARSKKKWGGLSEEYKKESDRKLKAKMRLKLVKDEETRCQEALTNYESEGLTEANDGTYLPFKRVWDEEGGDASAFEAVPSFVIRTQLEDQVKIYLADLIGNHISFVVTNRE